MSTLNLPRCTFLPWAILLTGVFFPLAASAQIATDSSLGQGAQVLAGPAYVIPETLGKLSGNNLFHSFETFNIQGGESATFTTATAGISNVISRVTGGAVSQINGTLSLVAASGQPNFYFINPAGVTFGAGAWINVPGAFHASTGNYIKFPDGNFYADTASASTFSSAEPAAYGFLGATTAPLIVKDSVLYNPAGGIALTAGDLTIDNAILQTGSGDIRIVANGAGPAEIGTSGALPAASGLLDISNGSFVYTAAGGNIGISAGDAAIRGGALIATDTSVANPAGAITMTLANLAIDGARVISRTVGSGNAGALAVDVADSIVLSNASQISSDSFGSGHSGTISLHASNDINILTDSFVSSDSYDAGNPGTINISSHNLTVDGTGGQSLTQISSQAFGVSQGNVGSINTTTSGTLSLIHGGKIVTSTYAPGGAGDIQVATGTLLLDGRNYGGSTGIFSTADFFSSGNAGTVNVDVAGDAQILHYGGISSDTWSQGNGGNVVFKANNLLIDAMGNGAGAGITSEARAGSAGQGGSVVVDVTGHLQLAELGFISTATSAQGNAGPVSVMAGQLTIDGKASGLAAIDSSSLTGSTGNAGQVSVTVAGDTLLTHGGLIRSDTQTAGQGGTVAVSIGGDLRVDQDGRISSAANNSGNAGNVGINVSGNLDVGGGGQIRSNTYGSGNAGQIDISASQVNLARGNIDDWAWIRSDTSGSGAGGSVNVRATKSINLSEGGFISSDSYSTGNSGTVSVSAPSIQIGGGLLLYGAAISSDAYAAGNAGRVEVAAQTLTIEGGDSYFPTGIASRSAYGSSGNAGTADVNASGALNVLSGGVITSSTGGSGRGGEVLLRAGPIAVNGTGSQIGAAASSFSTGQPGSVTVLSDSTIALGAGGALSIENDGNNAQPSTVTPTTLTVQAVNLTMNSGSIKANSTGNVDAGTLQIGFSDQLSLILSSITTSANSGNGGAINIQGGQQIYLQDSQITTSVQGLTGNGGDINLSAKALVMNTGFIQANTTAQNATGGNIAINVQTLLASGNTLFLGGQTPYTFAPGVFGFNVIQAAAPTGISGTVNVTAPVLDISGALTGLTAKVVDSGGLGRNPCQTTVGSSLSQAGRGGFPASSLDLLGPESTPKAASAVNRLPSIDLMGLAYIGHECAKA
ncbi:exported hypothetical protein [Candidatus Propionivibrio aalborgensis]|uniref:Filamentous haemagglutinin FhaB/tRNA nuclease CdiA-like TPS domain-containing protein n=1 Tax=Candidatus Propionivibrio aalborgensis TaxID=1860101 RepID=A0A1A8XKG2_9RHOO|nr:filamentous hemagglutinin N-terminal domain-containing protein [Candidatus Propionivibrio aalborgensis]SBT05625.1 exported hypothetical protein [Candidatus Propionivibrio aalborgensis]